MATNEKTPSSLLFCNSVNMITLFLRLALCKLSHRNYYLRNEYCKVTTIKKEREFQKNIYFCFIDYAKAFECVDYNKLKNSLRDVNTRPPYLLLEKSVCSSEATVRTGHGTTDWFQIRKGERQ